MTDLVSRQKEVIAPLFAFETDDEVVGSEGSWLFTRDGKKLLDFTCGIAVSNLGHQPQHVKNAIIEQVNEVWHSGSTFRYRSLVEWAENLRECDPGRHRRVHADELGRRIGRGCCEACQEDQRPAGHRGLPGWLPRRTMGSVSYTTSKAKYRQGYHPLVGSVFIAPYPWPFRWKMDQEAASAVRSRSSTTCSSMRSHRVRSLHSSSSRCKVRAATTPVARPSSRVSGIGPTSTASCSIMDEVQTGFGRTGEWFTSQIYGIRPDILVMGKGIANGLPLVGVRCIQRS